MSDYKKTIGLTPESKNVVESLSDNFDEQLDAARFAMSLAIKSGHEPSTVDNAETVWNVGSFDPDGEIRDLMHALFPEIESPYRTAEYFINRGFSLLETHLEENKGLDVVSLI